MRKIVFGITALALTFGLLCGCTGSKNETAKAETTQSPAVQAEISKAEPKPDSAQDLAKAEAKEPEAKDLEAKIYVFIAASLKNVMEDLGGQFNKLYPNVEVIYNPDSSGTLKTQIEEGAQCDVFFSAAMKQMNQLTEGGFVEDGSVVKLLENKVVLIKPKDGETAVSGFENIYEAKNMALAGEDVPVGAYSREIFESLGITDKVFEMEINECSNVTNVLAAITEGSNEVGTVYATDAASVKDKIDIIAQAPEGSLKAPVIYPVGLIKNSEADEDQSTAAKLFVEFLQTKEAIGTFEEYGFAEYK